MKNRPLCRRPANDTKSPYPVSSTRVAPSQAGTQLAMTAVRHERASRGAERPSFVERVPRKSEGAGKAGCAMHPQPRVQMIKKAHEPVTTGSPQHSGFPCTMVYGLFRALPGDRACLPPSPCGLPRKLDASVGAPGPHGFAVRQPVSFVVRHCPRPSHPAPTFVTIMIRPSGRARDGGAYRSDLGQT